MLICFPDQFGITSARRQCTFPSIFYNTLIGVLGQIHTDNQRIGGWIAVWSKRFSKSCACSRSC